MNRIVKDQIGNTFTIDSPPKRIVSLVPSLTELLFDLDLDKEIIGITRFCIHPSDKCKNIIKIGGTKDFNVDQIIDINPDFILASKEENTREGIEKLAQYFPVYVSDIQTMDDTFSFMRDIGDITDRSEQADSIIVSIRNKFLKVRSIRTSARIAYFIWRKPYMSVGKDTFIHHMLERIGFKNVYADRLRYPTISAEELSEIKPDFIFLSSEPYPFKERHIEEFQKICPHSKILLVNGEYFSWYGSRLIQSAGYMEELIAYLQNEK